MSMNFSISSDLAYIVSGWKSMNASSEKPILAFNNRNVSALARDNENRHYAAVTIISMIAVVIINWSQLSILWHIVALLLVCLIYYCIGYHRCSAINKLCDDIYKISVKKAYVFVLWIFAIYMFFITFVQYRITIWSVDSVTIMKNIISIFFMAVGFFILQAVFLLWVRGKLYSLIDKEKTISIEKKINEVKFKDEREVKAAYKLNDIYIVIENNEVCVYDKNITVLEYYSLVVSGHKLISMPPTPHECITSICVGKEEFTLRKLGKYI